MSGSGWRTIGASVRGASHVRRNQPNQDALLLGEGAAAVADGHGSATCFRSDIGAAIAVDVATVVMLEETVPPGPVLAERWRTRVEEHMAAHPDPDRELTLRAYGSTALAVRVTGDELRCLQIGDGDILLVDGSGAVTRQFCRNEILGVETESLCMRDAAAAVHYAATPVANTELVMLSTDGYANSFRDDEGFRRVASDLLAMIREDGLDTVAASLPLWLAEASGLGSGDDITVALLVREPVQEPEPEHPQEADGDA